MTDTPIQLNEAQAEGKQKILDWLAEERTDYNKIFRLFGYAGTGKTTLIRALMRELENHKILVLFAAPTGKAAKVLRNAGMKTADTLHAHMYRPIPRDDAAIAEIHKLINEERERPQKERTPGLLAQLEREAKELSKLEFELNPESALYHAGLLIIDECSMVADELLEDALTFPCPILAIGDPGQLEPVGDEKRGSLMLTKPDHMLTEIMRQAADNPIIAASAYIRTHPFLPFMDNGDFVCKTRWGFPDSQLLDYDIIITGKNVTRMDYNDKLRALKHGPNGCLTHMPIPGDLLVCNFSCKQIGGLLNGTIVELLELTETNEKDAERQLHKVKLRDVSDDENKPFECKMHLGYFLAYTLRAREIRPYLLQLHQRAEKLFKNNPPFDFAYAITAHKSQGSQWPRVLVIDDKLRIGKTDSERIAFGQKWLYTAITRAQERVTVLR